MYIPLVTSTTWRQKSSWHQPVPSDARKLIKRKHRLWARFQETGSNECETKYKSIRNLVRKQSRTLKKNTQFNIAKNCKSNRKLFWQYVSSKTSSFSSIGKIVEKDAQGNVYVCETDLDKANAFSNYFESVYSCEGLQDFEKLTQVKPPNSMPRIHISDTKVQQILLSLKTNKSPGPDSMHPRVLQELNSTVSSALKDIFEMSLRVGDIPEDWKFSTVTVIHKKGRKDCVENYRPISLTCVACKVMESLIRDQLMNYFLENNLISDFQYGFVKGRSTMLQLLKILDELTTCLEHGGQIDIIYTDFEKAFD